MQSCSVFTFFAVSEKLKLLMTATCMCTENVENSTVNTHQLNVVALEYVTSLSVYDDICCYGKTEHFPLSSHKGFFAHKLCITNRNNIHVLFYFLQRQVTM